MKISLPAIALLFAASVPAAAIDAERCGDIGRVAPNLSPRDEGLTLLPCGTGAALEISGRDSLNAAASLDRPSQRRGDPTGVQTPDLPSRSMQSIPVSSRPPVLAVPTLPAMTMPGLASPDHHTQGFPQVFIVVSPSISGGLMAFPIGAMQTVGFH